MVASNAVLTLAAAVALAGCFSEVNTSSRTYLGPAGSGVVVSHSVDESALEVTRLLEVRGYMLKEMITDTPEGERRLKFTKSNRPLSADSDFYSARDVGSVFYVWVTPDGTGSTVSLLGKPTFGGVEPCTHDGVLLTCEQLLVDKDLVDRFLLAKNETDVVRGVLAELQLEGYVVRAMPADAPPPTPDVEAKKRQAVLDDCHHRQHDVAVAAYAEKDPYKHTAIIRTLPHCDDDK